MPAAIPGPRLAIDAGSLLDPAREPIDEIVDAATQDRRTDVTLPTFRHAFPPERLTHNHNATQRGCRVCAGSCRE